MAGEGRKLASRWLQTGCQLQGLTDDTIKRLLEKRSTVDFPIPQAEFSLGAWGSLTHCKRGEDDRFSFPDKTGVCSSDYMPSVVYSGSLLKSSPKRAGGRLIHDGRLNVHPEVAEQVPG